MTEDFSAKPAGGGRLGRVARAVVKGAGLVLLVILAVAMLGAYAPRLPWIGAIGTVVSTLLVTWVALIALVAGALALRSLRRARRRRAIAALALSAATLAGAIGIVATQWRAAEAEGARIALAPVFMPWLGSSGSPSPDRTFHYQGLDGRALPIAVWQPPQPRGRPPILVYIHGGGWIMGENTMRGGLLRDFAQRGWLVVSLEYTLSSAQRHLWDRTTGELGCGLAWVRANAGSLGGDPGRVALFGDSAGGNLVTNVALLASAGTLPSICGGQAPDIRAVAALYPVVDPASFYNNPDAALGGPARRMAGGYTGGPPSRFADRYAAIASANKVHAGAPPLLALVGEADHLVPPEPTYAFADAARRAGMSVRLIRMPFGDHGFDGVPGSIGYQLAEQSVDAFLKARVGAPAQPGRPDR